MFGSWAMTTAVSSGVSSSWGWMLLYDSLCMAAWVVLLRLFSVVKAIGTWPMHSELGDALASQTTWGQHSIQVFVWRGAELLYRGSEGHDLLLLQGDLFREVGPPDLFKT